MHGTGLCNECITTRRTTWDRVSFRFQLSCAKLLDLKDYVGAFFNGNPKTISASVLTGLLYLSIVVSSLCYLSS